MVQPDGLPSSTSFFHLHLLDANYLQGKLNRAIPSHPAHKDICVMLGRLCTDTIVDVEAQVVKQREADKAEAKRLADEKEAKEAARLATEQKIKEMREELAKLTGAEVQPGPDQTLPQYIEQTGGGDDEEDEDEDEEEDEDEVMDSGSAGEVR
jgi:hypothetical protein